MLEIVLHELSENSKPFIKLEQHDFRPLLLILGRQKILELQKDTRCRDHCYLCFWIRTVQELSGKLGRGRVVVPELTCVPILGKGAHGERLLFTEVDFCLSFEIFECFLSSVSFVVELLERIKGAGG